MGYFITAIIFYIIGHSAGWISAHSTVATECERLGRFYVGERVFECVKITEQPKEKTND